MIDSRRKIRDLLIAVFLSTLLVFRSFFNDVRWYAGRETYAQKLRFNGPFVWVGSNEMAAYFVYVALFLGVRQAVTEFCQGRGLAYETSHDYVWFVRKPNDTCDLRDS